MLSGKKEATSGIAKSVEVIFRHSQNRLRKLVFRLVYFTRRPFTPPPLMNRLIPLLPDRPGPFYLRRRERYSQKGFRSIVMSIGYRGTFAARRGNQELGLTQLA